MTGLPIRVSSRKLRSLVVVALLAANVFVFLLAAYSLHKSRLQHERQAEMLTANMAAALDQHLSGSVARIDMALRAIAEELEHLLSIRAFDASQIEPLLSRYQAWLPEAEAIRIADADGWVVFGKGLNPHARPSWADREYFTHLRDHPEGGLQVSKPRVGRVAKIPIVGFARRFNHPDGRFAGVVSAPVAVEYFASLLPRFQLGAKGTVVLRDADLGLIARYPTVGGEAGTIGSQFVSKELRDLMAAGVARSTYHTQLSADLMERIVSYRRLDGLPMTAIAGMAAEDYLQPWEAEAHKTLTGVAVFALLSLLGTVLVLRLMAALGRESDRNELYLHHASDGVHILDERGNIVQASDSFCAMLGYGRGEVIGMNVTHWDARWPAAALLSEVLPDIIGRRSATTFETRHRRRDGEIIDVEVNAAGFELGGKRYLFASARDIRQSKQRESALRLAASVFSHAHEGIAICDAKQVILDVNPSFTEITGYSREEIIGRTPKALSSGRQDDAFYQAMWRSLQDQGKWDGEIWNRRKDGSVYAERLSISIVRDAEGRISHYIGSFSDISIFKEHQARLEWLAHYDALTQLPNRALLADRLEQALAQARRSGDLVAVCYLDLDGFKAINDQCGHEGGDVLLIEVAHRLRDVLRAGDTVARLGGDEFVLVLVGIRSVEECDRAAIRVLRALMQPITVAGQERFVSGSLGITLFPDDGSDADTLLRHADQAMYAAKQAGKNRYQLFDAAKDHGARCRREAGERLWQALAAGEFRLHYQPIVDLRAGQVLAFEGLIRWQHPERGLLPAQDFLSAVEGSELHVAIGRWVFDEGLRQLAAWRELGLSQGLSLNVAAEHLLSPDFADDLLARLAGHPALAAQALAIEVAESVAMRDAEATARVFRRCRAAGIEIALDDFGTGYASLSYFRRLPVDTLKVDQIFVQSIMGDDEDRAIVDGVIRLTQAFNRKLIAEGVETVEIGMLLLHMGCNVAQGHGIAPPMPAAEVPGWLAAFVPDPGWRLPVTQVAPTDMPLFLAELDHRAWVRELQAWLESDPQGPIPLALDSDRCRFGQWYSGPGRHRYGQLDAFAAIGATHEAVHRLGQEIVLLRQDIGPEAARMRIDELLALRDQLIEEIGALQGELILARF